jgi:hypothetical protein
MTQVLLLHAALTGADATGAGTELLARLPYAQRLELERRDVAARTASLAGIALVLEGARRLHARTAQVNRLRFPLGGKPSLHGGPHFSVSHSRLRVGVALCGSGEVGLDLEDLPGGSAGRGAGVGSLEQWTAVEAALKFAGAGLREAGDVHLSEDLAVARLAGALFHLRPLLLAPGCVACLATGSPVSQLTVEEIPIPWRRATGSPAD